MMSTTRKIEVEDTGVLNVMEKWNIRINERYYAYLSKNFEGSITILGEKGTVKVGGLAVNEIKHWQFDKAKEYDKKLKMQITRLNLFMDLVINFIIKMQLRFWW